MKPYPCLTRAEAPETASRQCIINQYIAFECCGECIAATCYAHVALRIARGLHRKRQAGIPRHRRAKKTEPAGSVLHSGGVADGTRTHDNWNHNPGLYQLSYSHHRKLAPSGIDSRSGRGRIMGEGRKRSKPWSAQKSAPAPRRPTRPLGMAAWGRGSYDSGSVQERRPEQAVANAPRIRLRTAAACQRSASRVA